MPGAAAFAILVSAAARGVNLLPLPQVQPPRERQIEILRPRATNTIPCHGGRPLVVHAVAVRIGSSGDGIGQGRLSAEVGADAELRRRSPLRLAFNDASRRPASAPTRRPVELLGGSENTPSVSSIALPYA